VQIAPETCRAKDERNKEYSVHVAGPELNIYKGIIVASTQAPA
jgi:hypothetical protein